ncbi:MAG: hypothetical protein HKN13_03455 [Rhodothermales bacterium]|nr:hypothetical protein [Rhodothermales bacterium]
MTVLVETDFEAEAIDLDDVLDQVEIFPGDPHHYIGPLGAELRLIGTRQKYQVCLLWDWDGDRYHKRESRRARRRPGTTESDPRRRAIQGPHHNRSSVAGA